MKKSRRVIVILTGSRLPDKETRRRCTARVRSFYGVIYTRRRGAMPFPRTLCVHPAVEIDVPVLMLAVRIVVRPMDHGAVGTVR